MKKVFSLLTMALISLPNLYSQRLQIDEHDIRLWKEDGMSQRIIWTMSVPPTTYVSLASITGVNNTSSGFLGLDISAAKNIEIRTDNIEIEADNLDFNTDNISTLKNYSDFAFLHESGSSAQHGITFRNNGGNNNYWTFYTLNGTGDMSLTRNGTVVGTFASNGVYSASDKKLKENIKPLYKVLPRLLNLTPNEYNYIGSDNQKKSIGFIAQDVVKYFPELVLDDPMDDGEVIMQLNYAGFGVLAIKAIQEQQDQIVSQKLIMNVQHKRIEKQEQIVESMQSQINDLLVRISSLEEQEGR